jgi:uncharacterized membrane-anchored protein YhcB (DUF1043 family)
VLSDFFPRLLSFSQKNGPGSVFFACLITGVLLLTVGFLLRSLENQKYQFNNIVTERLELAKRKFELSKQEIEYEYLKATEAIDRFNNEYQGNIETLKADLQNKISRFDVAQEKSVVENTIKLQKVLNALNMTYAAAKNELLRMQDNLAISFDSFKNNHKEIVIETNRKFHEDFTKTINIYRNEISLARRKNEDNIRKALKVYDEEIVKISYVRSEIELFLDEIQKELQKLEKKVSTQLPNTSAPNLNRLILVRMKINAFLGEYREKMDNLKTSKLPQIEYSMPQLAYELPEVHYIEISKPKFLAKDTVLNKIERIDDQLKDIRIADFEYKPLASTLKAADVFNQAAMPGFQGSPPQLYLDDALSVEGLETFIESGKFWILPTACGLILIAFSFLFGFYVIQVQIQHTSN